MTKVVYTYTTKDGDQKRIEIPVDELNAQEGLVHHFIPDEHKPVTELTMQS